MIIKIYLFIKPISLKKIIDHAEEYYPYECGGFIVGKYYIIKNIFIGFEDEIFKAYNENKSRNSFIFTPKDQIAAYNFAKQTDNVILGTYHSHGKHDAFISLTDSKFLENRAGMEFFLVYSPETKNWKFKFKYFDILKKHAYIEDAEIIPNPLNFDS